MKFNDASAMYIGSKEVKNVMLRNVIMWKGKSIIQATGGDIVEDVEIAGKIHRIHKFTTLGLNSFEVTDSGAEGKIDLLVVAGGGSGGQGNTTNANGGGGGGGVLYKENHLLSTGSFPIMVGDGGVAIGDGVASAGYNGENSYFGDFIAIGGGGGGGRSHDAKSGGSAGGLSLYATSATTEALQTDVLGATGYGNLGGQSPISYTGCGGGGAGTAGENGSSSSPGGDGGRGFLCSITGEEVGYAGGGGGGANSSQRAGDGWHGGGRGKGTTSHYGYTTYTEEINSTTKGYGTPDAVPNSGGGGGAGTYWSTYWSSLSGKGGSGIVIIKYLLEPM